MLGGETSSPIGGCSYGKGRVLRARSWEDVNKTGERETFVMLSPAGGGLGRDGRAEWHTVLRSNGRSESACSLADEEGTRRASVDSVVPPRPARGGGRVLGFVAPCSPRSLSTSNSEGNRAQIERHHRPRSAAFHTRLIWAPGQERAQGEIQRPMVRSRVNGRADDEMEGAVTRENPPNIALCGTTALLVRLNASACPTSPYCAV